MANQTELAAHLDLSTRRVRSLVADGIIPATKGKGGFNLDSCRLAYIGYLRGLSSGQVKNDSPMDSTGTSYVEMLDFEKYREKKMKNDIADGESAPIELLSIALDKTFYQLTSILEALPLNIKRANPSLTGGDITVIKKEVAKCFNAMASAEIDIPDE